MPDHPSGADSERDPDQRLRRSDRLRNGKDFRRVNRTGHRKSSRHFVVVSAPAREGAPAQNAIGLAVSKRVGNAVERNHVKRRVRSWFRTHRMKIEPGQDLVVIARQGAAKRTGSQIAEELSGLVQ